MYLAEGPVMKARCKLSELWHCLKESPLAVNQVVMVTVENGNVVLIDAHTLATLGTVDRDVRIRDWQILTVPAGGSLGFDSPKTVLEKVRQRDTALRRLEHGGPFLTPSVVRGLQRLLGEIEAFLGNIPADVDTTLREAKAAVTTATHLTEALEKYGKYDSWSKAADGAGWLWVGSGSEMEGFDEPWSIARQGLGKDSNNSR